MIYLLYDTARSRKKLYPFSLTRPVCDIRSGMMHNRGWIEKVSGQRCYALSVDYLQQDAIPDEGPFLCIDSSLVLTQALFDKFQALSVGQSLEDEQGLLGFLSEKRPVFDQFPLFFDQVIKVGFPVSRINHPMDWVKNNATTLCNQISLFCGSLSPVNLENFPFSKIYGGHPVYFGEGVSAMDCTINSEDGPVYIGKNVLIMEGVCIRGPVAIAEGAVLKMGAQIYGGTTIGKSCIFGGEIKNSLIGDYSNKAHHGYLGDSLIGQWCNLGAGTTNSNVKNNAGIVKMWSEETQSMIPQGQKAGLLMGDYSKSGINMGFQTGSTVGVCCSIHEALPSTKNIRSFTWGIEKTYLLEKALKDIEAWFQFKKQTLTTGDGEILKTLYKNEKLP